MDPTTARDSRASPVPSIPITTTTNPPSTRMRKRSMRVFKIQDLLEGIVLVVLLLSMRICWLGLEAVLLYMAIRRQVVEEEEEEAEE